MLVGTPGGSRDAEHFLAILREDSVVLDAHPRLDRDLRRRLPAILEIGAVGVLVRLVRDRRRTAVDAAQGVALEEHVLAAGGTRRTEIPLDRRRLRARLVLDVRIEVGAATELVRAETIRHHRHRRRQVDHRAVRRVDGSEAAFLRDRGQASEDIARRVALNHFRRDESRVAVGQVVVRLVEHEAADELEDAVRAHHPVVVEARQRSTLDQRSER